MHEGDDRECHLCADACAPGRAFTGACAGRQERGQVARLYAHQENAAAAVVERRGASRASGCWPGVRRGRAECMQIPACARACARLRPRRDARPCQAGNRRLPRCGAGRRANAPDTNERALPFCRSWRALSSLAVLPPALELQQCMWGGALLSRRASAPACAVVAGAGEAGRSVSRFFLPMTRTRCTGHPRAQEAVREGRADACEKKAPDDTQASAEASPEDRWRS